MNKKGDYFNCIILSLIFIFVCLLIAGMIDIHFFINPKQDKVCKDLGLKEYSYKGDYSFCNDRNKNLHYIDIECSGFFWWKDCKAKLISVGNVRTIGGLQ